MSVLAAIRPGDWDIALFLHVLGAMAMVGGLALAAIALVGVWRGGAVAMTRLAYRALLLVTLPGWVVMRFAGEWIASKEDLSDDEPAWLGIGYMTSEPGLLLIIIATVTAGLALRKAARADAAEARAPRAATVLVGVLLVAYVVAIWAMTAKPT